MTAQKSSPVDFLKELRLRRWARENYVTAKERKSGWHPIVLDEMRRKDIELAQTEESYAGQRFVPLEPMPLRAIHPAHPAPGNPNVRFDGNVVTQRAYAVNRNGDLLED